MYRTYFLHPWQNLITAQSSQQQLENSSGFNLMSTNLGDRTILLRIWILKFSGGHVYSSGMVPET